jgi:hypothetical protein
MHTSLGGKFFPADPRPEEVFIDDIANGLALDCRYAGQGRVDRYYSVAEHSFHISRYLLWRYQSAPDAAKLALVGLLHDASEAYCNDLPRAVKEAVGEGYDRVENAIQAAIWERFGLTDYYEAVYPVIKDADRRMIPMEKAVICAHPEQEWAADDLAPLDGVRISCWHPSNARHFFLVMYHELTNLIEHGEAA